MTEEKTQLCQFVIVQLALPLPLSLSLTHTQPVTPLDSVVSPIAPSHFRPLRDPTGLKKKPTNVAKLVSFQA